MTQRQAKQFLTQIVGYKHLPTLPANAPPEDIREKLYGTVLGTFDTAADPVIPYIHSRTAVFCPFYSWTNMPQQLFLGEPFPYVIVADGLFAHVAADGVCEQLTALCRSFRGEMHTNTERATWSHMLAAPGMSVEVCGSYRTGEPHTFAAAFDVTKTAAQEINTAVRKYHKGR